MGDEPEHPIGVLFACLKGKAEVPFNGDIEIPEAHLRNLPKAIEYVWEQDWSVAEKACYIGAIMFVLGTEEAESLQHPVVNQLIEAIENLDDQGIDVIGAHITLHPRTSGHRPSQMKKWPGIHRLS